MKVRLGANVEVDILTQDELRKALADHRRELARILTSKPIPRTVADSIQLDATGAGVIDLGVPSPGRTWNVRRVAASYQDPTAALAAGIVAVFRGNDATNPLNFVERIGNGTQVPATTRFSTDQLVLAQDEHLFLRVSGGTPSVAVFGSAQVVDALKGVVYDLDEDELAPAALSSVV